MDKRGACNWGSCLKIAAYGSGASELCAQHPLDLVSLPRSLSGMLRDQFPRGGCPGCEGYSVNSDVTRGACGARCSYACSWDVVLSHRCCNVFFCVWLLRLQTLRRHHSIPMPACYHRVSRLVKRSRLELLHVWWPVRHGCSRSLVQYATGVHARTKSTAGGLVANTSRRPNACSSTYARTP